MKAARAFSREDVRRILLENLFFLTEAELCGKWGVSRYRLRRWKSEFRYKYFHGEFRDWVIASLYSPLGPRFGTVESIISYLDWWNHCRYAPSEVLPVLERLEKDGVAVRRGDLWDYNRARLKPEPAFIF